MRNATLVIDITYRCNARCAYCRWGDGRTAERRDTAVADLCVEPAILHGAAVGRVVLSGGEPLLHPGLSDVLAYYASADVPERVVITNGLLASEARVQSCHRAGATGFAFSIDAVDETVALAARAMDKGQVHRVLTHLAQAGRYTRAHGLELTVNCVLSSANCELAIIRELARRAAACGASAIKFQPVFDDGFLGAQAPGLRLDGHHAANVRAIADDAPTWGIAANSPAFFRDLAAVCEGRALDGASCGLAGRTFVLQNGGVAVCPWIAACPASTASALADSLRDFDTAKLTCSTGAHCFCLQPRDQDWRLRDAVH